LIEKITSILLNKLIIKSKQRILIPFYHVVSDAVPVFTKHLYLPRNIADFEKDLDVLLKFYRPISLKQLLGFVKSGESINQNYFHLTFDDGLSNFYEIVAPILKKRKIPATVFLNTDFVDNKALFYRYKASLLLENYIYSNTEIKNIYHQFLKQNKFSNIEVSEFLLRIEYENKQILDELAKILNFNFSDFLNSEQPYLSKTQINELVSQDITFGAHSTNHPFYYKLPLEVQIKHTVDSLNWIENELKQDFKAFSFPFADFGVQKTFFKKMASENMDISFGTSGIKKDVIKNNLQRISFENFGKNTKLYLIKEYLKYFLKIPLGKSIMKR